MPDDRSDQLRLAALSAIRAANELADEVDHIVDESLPWNAPRSLKSHLRRVATRQRDIAAALARELDDLTPDRELVGHLTHALRRAAALFVAGVMFAGGAGATGALEDLGADVKDSLLRRTTAVEDAVAGVESAIGASREQPPSPAPEPPPEPGPTFADGGSRLLSALDARDLDALNKELVFILRFERTLREVVISEARVAYGDDWLEVLSRDPAEHPQNHHPNLSPSRLTFRDLVLIIRRMGQEGHPPPALETDLPSGRKPADVLLRMVDLRNEYAHGLTYDADWWERFVAQGGRELLVDAEALSRRIGED